MNSKKYILAVSFVMVNLGMNGFDAGLGQETSPYISSVIFTLSVAVLLLEDRSLTKLLHCYGPFELIIQLFVYLFVMEIALKLVWFPMEKSLMDVPSKISESIARITKIKSLRFSILNMFEAYFETKGARIICSYCTSLFLLLATFQFVQFSDIRILFRHGVVCFLRNAIQRNFCLSGDTCALNATSGYYDGQTSAASGSGCETPVRRRRSRTTRRCCGGDDFD